MQEIKQLDLFNEVERRHPDAFIKGRRGNRDAVTLIELGGKDFRTPEMVSLLKEYWQPTEDDILYIINLEKIDVLTPSAAKILVESVPDIASKYKTPVIFIEVRPKAMEQLESATRVCDPQKLVWAIDEDRKPHLVGPVEKKKKLKELLDLLGKQGPASASQLAIITEGATSKKAVGNLSGYLNDLFNAGLVSREKVTALDRDDDAERGWTYIYRTAPTSFQNSKPEAIIRKP